MCEVCDILMKDGNLASLSAEKRDGYVTQILETVSADEANMHIMGIPGPLVLASRMNVIDSLVLIKALSPSFVEGFKDMTIDPVPLYEILKRPASEYSEARAEYFDASQGRLDPLLHTPEEVGLAALSYLEANADKLPPEVAEFAKVGRSVVNAEKAKKSFRAPDAVASDVLDGILDSVEGDVPFPFILSPTVGES